MVVENIVELARKIESETNARVILSELVTRSAKVSNDSVKTENKKLKKFCNQNNWKLVQHQNITINDQSGQNLNNRGNNILFNNFVNCLDYVILLSAIQTDVPSQGHSVAHYLLRDPATNVPLRQVEEIKLLILPLLASLVLEV